MHGRGRVGPQPCSRQVPGEETPSSNPWAYATPRDTQLRDHPLPVGSYSRLRYFTVWETGRADEGKTFEMP